MATIYTPIGEPIDPFQARIFADNIDVYDSVFAMGEFTPPHILRPCTTFQWVKDGEDIAGAINDTYTVSTNTVANSGTYHCRITIGFDSDGPTITAMDGTVSGTATSCIVENTDPRIVSIVDCGTPTSFTVFPATATIVYPSYESLSAFTADATWVSGTSVVTTVDNVSTAVFTFAAQAGGARRAFGTILIGEFECIFSFGQDFVSQQPPPVIMDTPGGPSILRILNDGPSGVSAECSRYTLRLREGIAFSGSLRFVTCNGEDGFVGFGIPTASTNREVEIVTDRREIITDDNFTYGNAPGRFADFTITSVPEPSFGAVIITPQGGFVDTPGDAANLEFTYVINGITVARNTGPDPIDRGMGTMVGPGLEAYYVLPTNESVGASNTREASIILISESPQTVQLDITLTDTSTGITSTATDNFIFEDIADVRTDGEVSGDTSGSISCSDHVGNDMFISSGTFNVDTGTANVVFSTSGNTPFAQNNQMGEANLLYTVNGGRLTAENNGPLRGIISSNGPTIRSTNHIQLQELPVGTYTWTMTYFNSRDLLFPHPLGDIVRCNMGALASESGSVGSVEVTGNTFF